MTRAQAHRQPLFREHQSLLRDTVLDSLQSAILDGTLRPGQLLRNGELESWLGVSRTPIREALNRLSRIGLVEMQANRYTRVAVHRRGEALKTAQTLGILAVGVLRLTVIHLDEQERIMVAAALRSVETALRHHDMIDARNQAFNIWRDLAARSGNRSLQRELEDSGAAATFRLTPRILNTAMVRDDAAEWIGRLAHAISIADGAGAEEAVEHLYHVPPRSHPYRSSPRVPEPGETY